TVAPASTGPARAAADCHPHPRFGGTMHNKVVFQTARALHARGIPVLRFNFRGAALSEGKFDGGVGEQEDVRAALDYLAVEFPAVPILLAGFSFGSWVGLRVGCADARVRELIGLGLPVNDSDFSYLETCRKPKLILQDEKDPYGSRSSLEALFLKMPEPKKLVFIPGGDHFFAGKLAEVGAAIDSWLAERPAAA
ncbi:MAG: alpha/beta hydrolase, partial [Steroidobacteraceae bacterium]